jgi:hypothetical protein
VAQRAFTVECEDVPLDEARHTSRGPRMDRAIDSAPKQDIPSLDHTATRMTIPESTAPTTMKNRLLRIAAERGMPVTIRRVSGGLLIWHVTDEDFKQPKEGASRRHTARRKRPRVRRRRT